MNRVVNPEQIAQSLDELWSPRVVGEVDEVFIKVAKVHGQLTWHAHEHEDELFLILRGRLRIEMEHETVVLNAGEMFIVPKGIRHNPIANEECLLLLVEKKSTLHTGDVVINQTRSIADQLRPIE